MKQNHLFYEVLPKGAGPAPLLGGILFSRILLNPPIQGDFESSYSPIFGGWGAFESNFPTRLRVGSHRAVAQMLEPAGEEGLSFFEVSDKLGATEECPEVLATGEAGTVYLCHPFLVHAAQINRGSQPRFMAQPPLLPTKRANPPVSAYIAHPT